MMKKILNKKIRLFSFYIYVLSVLFVTDAFAINYNSFYINDNGVELSEEEYKIIFESYGEEYIKNMTQDDYSWFDDLFVSENKIEINTYYNVENSSRATSHSTSSKKITIVKSCSTAKCTMITTTQWLSNPVIRSYDVIGARFDETSLYSNSITTRVISTNGVEYFDNLKQYSTGFGVSVKLPDNASNIVVDQKFYVNPDGIVFASYQHATKDISLAISKLYTLGVNGYGNVFNFYGAALSVFDKMGGVNITL